MVSTPLKNISQLGVLFPIYGKIKNVPNHQLAIIGFMWYIISSIKSCVLWMNPHVEKVPKTLPEAPSHAHAHFGHLIAATKNMSMGSRK